jgi:hypothetical protein
MSREIGKMQRELRSQERKEKEASRRQELALRKAIEGHVFSIDSLKSNINGIEAEKKVLIKFGFRTRLGTLDVDFREKMDERIKLLQTKIADHQAEITALKSHLPPGVFSKLWSWVTGEQKAKKLQEAKENTAKEAKEAAAAKAAEQELKAKERLEVRQELETEERMKAKKLEALEQYKMKVIGREEQHIQKIRKERAARNKITIAEEEPRFTPEEFAEAKRMGLRTEL